MKMPMNREQSLKYYQPTLRVLSNMALDLHWMTHSRGIDEGIDEMTQIQDLLSEIIAILNYLTAEGEE